MAGVREKQIEREREREFITMEKTHFCQSTEWGERERERDRDRKREILNVNFLLRISTLYAGKHFDWFVLRHGLTFIFSIRDFAISLTYICTTDYIVYFCHML